MSTATDERRTWQDLAQRFVNLKRDSETELAPEGMTNPASVYTDPEHFGLEWETLFRRAPFAVALSSDLASAGDYVTANIGGTPIVITRDDSGELHSMVNICKHRGTRLIDQCGHLTGGLRCPYHAWTYDLTGKLRTTPYSGSGFEPEQVETIRLGELPVWERHGIVFTAAQADEVDASALDDLDQFANDFEAIDFRSYKLFREQVSVWPMNWKLGMDAFLEHYHIFSLHRNSIAPIFVPIPSLFDGRGWISRMCVFRKHTDTNVEGLETDTQFRGQGNLSYILFPSSVINMPVSGQVELWQIQPESQTSTRITSRLYVNKPVESARQIGYWNKNFEMSRDVNFVEDFPLQRTVHDSLYTGEIKELIYGRNEPALIYYHKLLAKRLGTAHG